MRAEPLPTSPVPRRAPPHSRPPRPSKRHPAGRCRSRSLPMRRISARSVRRSMMRGRRPPRFRQRAARMSPMAAASDRRDVPRGDVDCSRCYRHLVGHLHRADQASAKPEENDIIQPPPEDETFVPGEEEAPAKPGEADAQHDWILVFSPSDPTTVNAPGDTKADAMSGRHRRFPAHPFGRVGVGHRLRRCQGRAGADRRQARGVRHRRPRRGRQGDADLGRLQFRRARRLRPQALPGRLREGRVPVRIELPAKAPGAEGTIAINSDVDNAGKALDVYEIKVSVGE